MKTINKILLSVYAIFFMSGLLLPVLVGRATALETNLIANASAETADATDPTLPQAWSKGGWGTNDHTLSLSDTAHTGSKSLNVTVSAYTSGDAKWFFAPVAVSANAQYKYSDFYQSTVVSEIVAQLDDGAGNYSYIDLGPAAATGVWTQTDVSFTTTSTTKNVTVFHLIAGAGSLTTDDFSLTAVPVTTPEPAPVSTNLVANPSTETADSANAALPQAWTSDNWGTNTPVFSYSTTAHSGTRSLQTQVTSYTSGDAKWYFSPVTATANTKYSFSDYYKSDVPTYIAAQLDDGKGNYTYLDLGSAAASTTWQQYSVTFTTAANTKSVTVFHVIADIGTLSVDDFSLIAGATTAPSTTNLLTNGSFETADSANSAMPASWAQDEWGTNTHSYSYLTTGHTGTRSGKVQITSYTSGDAKWYFSPITASGNTLYNFSDYYKSDIASDVVAQLDDGAGNYTYIDLGTAAAGADWQQYVGAFTTDASTKKVTIFHVINGVGSLTVDDYILTTNSTAPTDPTPPVTPTTLIPNASVETVSAADATTPQSWYKGSYDSNTSVFTYLTTGHTGGHSVRVDMSNYVSGGANWSYDAPVVTPGKQYSFTDYYQSNTLTQVLVAAKLSTGTTQYIWLGNPYTSDGTWSKFSGSFTMPANTVTATVYHSISGNGYLITDDYSLAEYTPQGFNAPMVSVTFDDGIASQYENALPILNKYSLKGTFYVVSGLLNSCDPTSGDICYMTGNQVKDLYAQGNEIGSHTVDHADLTSLTKAQIDAELADSKASLQALVGNSVTNFASPYGQVNATVLAETGKYYTSQRGVQIGYNTKDNYNQMELKVQDINSTTTVAQVQSYIDAAKASKSWLILMYHDIDADPTVDAGYDTLPVDFDAHMAYLKASGVNVVTMQQGLAIAATQL